jgi:chromosome segregation ATPase
VAGKRGTKSDELTATRRTLEEAEAELGALIGRLHEAGAREASLREQLEGVAREVSERDAVIARVSADNDNLDAAWSDAQAEVARRDRRVAELERQVAELAAREALLRQRVEDLQTVHVWRAWRVALARVLGRRRS